MLCLFVLLVYTHVTICSTLSSEAVQGNIFNHGCDKQLQGRSESFTEAIILQYDNCFTSHKVRFNEKLDLYRYKMQQM